MNDRGLKSGKIFLYENTLRDEKRNTSVGIKGGLRNGGKGSSVFRTRWFIPMYRKKNRCTTKIIENIVKYRITIFRNSLSFARYLMNDC